MRYRLVPRIASGVRRSFPHELCGHDANRLWPEMRVSARRVPCRPPVLGEVEMGDLMNGVHAGIGPARAGEPDMLSREARDRRLDRAWTVRSSACRCQPQNGLPSYSMTSL